jgi:FAD/FMN-containing dehydrogenase
MKRRTNSYLGVGAVVACVFAAYLAYFQPLRIGNRTVESPIVPNFNATGQSAVCVSLAAALPDIVYTKQHPTFQASKNSHWSQNACESEPACIVQPTTTQEVAEAVKVLKAGFDAMKEGDEPLQFAVRSGGHAPERGFASVDQGVVIDMSRINEVELAEDRQSTSIGVGAQWQDVSVKLDEMGLAVVGGRSASVGVGGLVLGGMCAIPLSK